MRTTVRSSCSTHTPKYVHCEWAVFVCRSCDDCSTLSTQSTRFVSQNQYRIIFSPSCIYILGQRRSNADEHRRRVIGQTSVFVVVVVLLDHVQYCTIAIECVNRLCTACYYCCDCVTLTKSWLNAIRQQLKKIFRLKSVWDVRKCSCCCCCGIKSIAKCVNIVSCA